MSKPRKYTKAELLPYTAGMSKASAKRFINNAQYTRLTLAELAAHELSISKGGKPGVIPS